MVGSVQAILGLLFTEQESISGDGESLCNKKGATIFKAQLWDQPSAPCSLYFPNTLPDAPPLYVLRFYLYFFFKIFRLVKSCAEISSTSDILQQGAVPMKPCPYSTSSVFWVE